MSLFSRKSTLPTADRALAGSDEPVRIDGTHTVLGTSMVAPWPAGSAVAVFGMGCFWGIERLFWRLPGVSTTAAGYAGGPTPNPSYDEVCSGRTGHAEVVLVVYDPSKISYNQLLRAFWENHDPTQGMRQGNDRGTQYRSAIYTTTPEQQEPAESSREAYQASLSAARHGGDHHRDRAADVLLLRGGLPPAVSRQEPARLLQHARHRGCLLDRRDSGARGLGALIGWARWNPGVG